jgi:hypothetical protein
LNSVKKNYYEHYRASKKDKILGPDGLLVELFLGCYNFIEEDLLRVVEFSRSTIQTLATFNSTFIALIPNIDNPSRFKSFITISLCNNIYKIISKIIARRLKGILSRQISLAIWIPRRHQIHEAVGMV